MVSPKKNLIKIIALSIGACFLFNAGNALATFISPQRVFIKKNQRTATMTILNESKETVAYTFEWQHRAQKNGGEIILFKEGEALPPKYKPLDKYVQYSPRRIILKPGQKQRLRMLVRRTPDMQEGEYHSHIQIKGDPLIEDAEQGVVGKMGGAVQTRVYVAIPVFLQHGNTTLDFDVTHAQLLKKDGKDFINFQVKNRSTRSAYINLFTDCTRADGSIERTPIVTMRLYSESDFYQDEVATPLNVSFDQCTSIDLDFFSRDDIEYREQSIKKIKLR